MFGKTASYIIRFRIPLLVVFLLLTAYMAFRSREVAMSYKLATLMPKTDSSYVAYERFKQIFGQDGNIIIVANKESRFFTAEHLNAFFRLQEDLGKIPGVKQTGGIKNVLDIVKDTVQKKFVANPVWKGNMASDADAMVLENNLTHLPFYNRVFFDLKKDVFLILVTLDQKVLNTKERLIVVDAIEKRVNAFRAERSTEMHISGLPYIRAVYVKKAKREITLFVGLAALVTAVVLIIIFRSFIEVIVPLVTVLLGVIWAQGSLGVLGYEITILTGLIPPLLIVIGVPNAIYIINKYHQEYNLLGDKTAALTNVIAKTGQAIFLTNLTTAIGFGTFVITGSDILVEFGIVAFFNIMLLFLLSLIFIPILFSFLPPPSVRVRAHLDKRLARAVIRLLILISQNFRPWVYGAIAVIVVISAIGISRIEVKGNLVDDVPEKSDLMKDLRFFENAFGGVMPLEITVDTRKERGVVTDVRTWRKIEEFQDYLDAQPIFSRPISYIEGIKFANQAFYNGNPDAFRLPNQFDRVFIVNYLKQNEGRDSLLSNFMNKDKSVARISVMMKDLNTIEIQQIKDDLQKKAAEIFPEEKYKVDITGGSITFLEGTKYLVWNLLQSLLLAVFLISLFMAMLFRNVRIVLISLIPNLIPMVVTASVMGFLGIALKPSTILVFSVAFGISVDDTIHYLAKFKEELKYNGGNIRSAVVKALQEVGLSMAYTSIVLFFGFSVFAASEFGGTVALGTLVSFSLLAAMFTNLILLPSLLMTLHNSKSNRRRLRKRRPKSVIS
jgi:hypothetical protein